MAYDPLTQNLHHIETSGDADSWAERKQRFLTKKFILTRDEYQSILGTNINTIKKKAIVGYSRSTKAKLDWGKDIEVVLVPDLIKQVAEKLRSLHPTKEAVPETYPVLRAMQACLAWAMREKKPS